MLHAFFRALWETLPSLLPTQSEVGIISLQQRSPVQKGSRSSLFSGVYFVYLFCLTYILPFSYQMRGPKAEYNLYNSNKIFVH